MKSRGKKSKFMTSKSSSSSDDSSAAGITPPTTKTTAITKNFINREDFLFGIETSHLDVDHEDSMQEMTPMLKYVLLGMICLMAFSIRLFSVVRYESVIHEFDPYFNYRTTKYLTSEGFLEFLNWFDDRAWYPLGRIIGGTIYPGLMYTAAMIYWVLNYFFISINVRNMCVFLAPIFSAFTAVASFLLTKEVTKRTSTGLLAAVFTAIVPSYISRSVGGSYDNEGVAIFALLFCFYLWVKSVHTGSMFWSLSCALSYFYMVAAWGGYVFIINLIPIYVLVMLFAGRYSPRLYIAYSTFYTIGSILAMQVPFVGFNVIKQAECAGSHGVFVLLQVVACMVWIRSLMSPSMFKKILIFGAGSIVLVLAGFLILLQLMGKVQWTGRSLSLLDPTYASKYIPIIASVSEHQPTSWSSFFFDLHILVPLSPVGMFFLYRNLTDGAIFLILYGTVAWYFAGVMVRLMLTLSPIACILAAIGTSTALRKLMSVMKHDVSRALAHGAPSLDLSNICTSIFVVGLSLMMVLYSKHAVKVSSMAYSNPSIVVEAGRHAVTGERQFLDDYREAYYWMRQNTAEDAKILAWWDYGYQMSSMANRTVIVDNNTWNNTHIATVGRALASPEAQAYPILQSLDVDYVLVIFGGYVGYSSDDINKFLWPVRIGSGVFPDDMPHEKDFYSSQGRYDIGPGGSPHLHESLAYKLCYYRFGEVQLDYNHPKGFDRVRQTEVGVKDIELTHHEEAFTSEHWMVRIFKVKKPEIVTSALTLQQKKKKTTKTTTTQEKTRFLGCMTSENMLGQDKVYHGGASGANFDLALYHAQQRQMKYLAISRVGQEGHVFAFDDFDTSAQFDGNDGGCERPCLDRQDKFCGCADAACLEAGARPGAGQEHNRRWAVYSRTSL